MDKLKKLLVPKTVAHFIVEFVLVPVVALMLGVYAFREFSYVMSTFCGMSNRYNYYAPNDCVGDFCLLRSMGTVRYNKSTSKSRKSLNKTFDFYQSLNFPCIHTV